MRRRKIESAASVRPQVPVTRLRPKTSTGRQYDAGPLGQSVRASLESSFAPKGGVTYVDHLADWKSGQKPESLIRPFRKPDHSYRRDELLSDPRAPGSNLKRDHAQAVRELSRASAERNTNAWLEPQGKTRLLSASLQSGLGMLASRPLSELQAELDGPLREARRRPRSSMGLLRPHAAEGKKYDETSIRSRKQVEQDSNRVPRWRDPEIRKEQGPTSEHTLSDQETDEMEGYVDRLYCRVTDTQLDDAAQRLHDEYKGGFRSKIGGHISKRLQVSKQVFPHEHAQREYMLKERRRLGELIFVVHALYIRRRWVCRAKKTTLHEILREPFRCMISLLQCDWTIAVCSECSCTAICYLTLRDQSLSQVHAHLAAAMG